ncbi:unnamed protein product [Symbiodinium natans]|uniref:Uncharacterized protein n=1 Tax=Symbiodinium natans TaxID=878477 RepID=A0A812JJX2_9DINO|nr:unnamed protein product [Symbiodinium natans]
MFGAKAVILLAMAVSAKADTWVRLTQYSDPTCTKIVGYGDLFLVDTCSQNLMATVQGTEVTVTSYSYNTDSNCETATGSSWTGTADTCSSTGTRYQKATIFTAPSATAHYFAESNCSQLLESSPIPLNTCITAGLSAKYECDGDMIKQKGYRTTDCAGTESHVTSFTMNVCEGWVNYSSTACASAESSSADAADGIATFVGLGLFASLL